MLLPLPPMALQIPRTIFDSAPRPAVRYSIALCPEIVPLVWFAGCPGEWRAVHIFRLSASIISRSGCVGRVYIPPPRPSTLSFPWRLLLNRYPDFNSPFLPFASIFVSILALVPVLVAADPSNKNVRSAIPEDIEEAPATWPVRRVSGTGVFGPDPTVG